MNKSLVTYQVFTKITATLLLMAFLIPTGIHAKQLMDYCMMEMNHHSAAQDKSHLSHTSLSDKHCDSEPEKPNQADHEHADCDLGFICACTIGQSHLSDENWIPTTKNIDVSLTQQDDLEPFFASGESIQTGQQIRIGEYSPPLWLLYDTFLM